MAHVAKLNIKGDPNIGLYGIATDKICLLGKSVSKKQVTQISEALGVPVISATIYGTDYFGIFCAGTSDTILAPYIISKSEKNFLEKELAKLGIKLEIIKTDHTALGNNILSNDSASIISSVFTKTETKKIEKLLNTKTVSRDLGETTIPGSLGVLTNRGAILSPTLSNKELSSLEKFTKLELGVGTVNMGNPFLSSGIIANSKGFIVGRQTSGFEISRIDESLGFLNK